MALSGGEYQCSKNTPAKQESLRDTLELHIMIVQKLMKKYDWVSPRYLYYDLHAGPGKDIWGCPGSPLVFLSVAKRLKMLYEAHFYEAAMKHIPHLRLNTKEESDKWVFVHPQDHNKLIPELKKKPITTNRYGAIYVDPSNTVLPLDLLGEFGRAYPKIDIIINFACTFYKWTKQFPGYEPLDKVLLQIKPNWVIRTPLDAQQWSVMLGSEWGDYPGWDAKGFYHFKTTKGAKIWEQITRTKGELENDQPRLI